MAGGVHVTRRKKYIMPRGQGVMVRKQGAGFSKASTHDLSAGFDLSRELVMCTKKQAANLGKHIPDRRNSK